MRVVILHSDVRSCAPVDEQDVLTQVEAVADALRRLGHEALPMSFSLDLSTAAERLRNASCDLVFNLVETVGGQGRLIHLAPALLDSMKIPYTGAGTEATFLSSNKIAAKKLLRAHRLRTPPWCTLRESSVTGPFPPAGLRFIIKSVWEHASIGLEEDSVVCSRDDHELRGEIRKRLGRLGAEAFAEQYIDGREFNLSILSGRQGPDVLPPAEIDFVGYEKDRLRFVDYRAKWDETTYEYHHTPRRFCFDRQDRSLLRSLKRISLNCWRLFELRGYARVDYRVDGDGIPWILEINSNPCLSPDSGFTAATREAGLRYDEVIGRILGDTLRPE